MEESIAILINMMPPQGKVIEWYGALNFGTAKALIDKGFKT